MVAFLLWLFFAPLGLHKFYLGKIWRGVLYLLLGICGPIPFGLLTLILWGGSYNHAMPAAVVLWLFFGVITLPFLAWWIADLRTFHQLAKKAPGPPAANAIS